MFFINNTVIAFLLTLIAGLSTGIGSMIAFFSRRDNRKFLSVCLGFSAGVMIYVSMMEIYAKAINSLSAEFGERTGMAITIGSFFGGMLLICLIDKLLPTGHSPYGSEESAPAETVHTKRGVHTKLMRTGLFTALAIWIHNIPEGLATFISALQEPSVAIPIVTAIAIHNIPEGIAVSIPIYYATGNRKKAFFYSFISGLSEPIGAIIGYLLLMPFINAAVNGVLFALVAGIMVFISIDELLPSAQTYAKHHLSIYGFIAGMAIMALSLWLFI